MGVNVLSFHILYNAHLLFSLISFSRCCLHYCDAIMGTVASQITSLTIVYTTVYSDADQSKQQSSASLAFVWGIHRDRWIPRTKGQLRGKCFHLMTSSCTSSVGYGEEWQFVRSGRQWDIIETTAWTTFCKILLYYTFLRRCHWNGAFGLWFCKHQMLSSMKMNLNLGQMKTTSTALK